MAGKDRRFDARKLMLLRVAKDIVLVAAILFAIFKFVIGVSVVRGESMLNSYHDGQLVVYTRLGNKIERGNVVSVAIPTGDYYIKRVLAVGGDTVDLRDGVFYVNGEVETGDHINGAYTHPEDAAFTYPLTLGADEVFVVGDNRNTAEDGVSQKSVDSRYYGPFKTGKVQGIIRFALG